MKVLWVSHRDTQKICKPAVLSKSMLRFAAVASALIALFSSAKTLLRLSDGHGCWHESIHRFDGVTGAYFGSFGQGMLNLPESFAIDRTTGRAFVYEASIGLTRVFNYNTGAHLADLFSIFPVSVFNVWKRADHQRVCIRPAVVNI